VNGGKGGRVVSVAFAMSDYRDARSPPINLASQIHQHDVGVISQSIEDDPLAVGRDVEVLHHRAALHVEAGELTLLAGFEIQTEKILIRSGALKSDERLSARHEAVRRPE